MEKNKKNKKSPLLDLYLQNQNKNSPFDQMEEQDIAKALRQLLMQDEPLSKNLN